MNHTVVHFEIPFDDLEKGKKFYSELFGWKITAEPGFEDYLMVQTAPQGEGVDGGLMKKKMPSQCSVNYVQVESVEEFSVKVKQLGGQVVVPKTAIPKMGYFAVALDPENNCFGLWETDPSAA